MNKCMKPAALPTVLGVWDYPQGGIKGKEIKKVKAKLEEEKREEKNQHQVSIK